MLRSQISWKGWLGVGLLLGASGCVSANGDGEDDPGTVEPGDKPRSDVELRSSKTSLQRADDCPDLLTKIQEDAIAKLDLVVAQQKESLDDYLANPQGGADAGIARPVPGGAFTGGGITGGGITGGGMVGAGLTGGSGFIGGGGTVVGAGGTVGGTASGGTAIGGIGGVVGGTGASAGTPGGGGAVAPSPTAPPVQTPGDFGDGNNSAEGGGEPLGASETNTQVEGVDEADFVKLVDSGKGMFLLHGNTLRKLTTFPAEQLSLESAELKLEGSPSELFVTDAGTAVIFSSVSGYGHPPSGVAVGASYCTPGWCGGGGGFTKITVADVSGATPSAQREIYYRGDYVSSRRYGDVVRVVLQSWSTYSDLYAPNVEWTDAWGRYYEREQIEEQLDQWRDRSADSIRNTTLGDWLPVVQEVKDGKLVDVEPACGSYYVPQPGISEYGLTHVLSIDVSKDDAPVGGVTVVGQASTVYSNLDRLVLAQPDYRWLGGGVNFGFLDQQRTTLHMFELGAEQTGYLASGWVTGQLPPNNAQFGLDVAGDHTLRVATTGQVRKNPAAKPDAADFWETVQENRVFTLRQKGEELAIVGRSENLGHYEMGESIHSARFVGDRGYVVTFRRTDPLIVLDVATAESPKVLGEIEIPGFSQYMHPLDDTHLITFGQSGTGGSQLQLFDVSDPKNLPQPKLLDLGQSWSELSNNHKAFTFYAEQNLIALPISGNFFLPELGYQTTAGLKVIRVDPQSGFELLGSVDHTGLYKQQNCIVCDSAGGSCWTACSAPVEVRRGHFVQGEDATYVYAISYGGVSVSDVDALNAPIKTVVLPQTAYDGSTWYGTNGGGIIGGGSSIGGGVTGGIAGGGFVGGEWIGAMPGTVTPTPAPGVPPTMAPVDAGVDAQDGGMAQP